MAKQNFFVTGSKKLSRKRINPFVAYHFDRIPAGSKVLNVGSGGDFTEMLRAAADRNAFTITCSDIDPVRDPDVVDDICRSGFENNSFDAVVLISVLEHVGDPHLAAAEINRILKVGGRLILSVPFMYPIHDAPYDFTRFTSFGLRRLFDHMRIEHFESSDNWLEALLVMMSRVALQPKRAGQRWRIGLVPLALALYPIATFLGGRNDFITTNYCMTAVKLA